MTKQNGFLVSLAILGLSAMMASCGGGSGSSSSGKKLASNEFLGDLPNLIYQYVYQDSVITADWKAAEDKFNEPFQSGKKMPTESDWKKAKELDEKWKAKGNEAKAKFAAEIEKIKPSLIGREIPVEMEEEIGFEVTPAKIIDVSGIYITVETSVTITDAQAKGLSMLKYGRFDYSWQILDKEGNRIGSNCASSQEIGRENGATGTIKLSIGIANPQQFVNFEKIRFVKD